MFLVRLTDCRSKSQNSLFDDVEEFFMDPLLPRKEVTTWMQEDVGSLQYSLFRRGTLFSRQDILLEAEAPPALITVQVAPTLEQR